MVERDRLNHDKTRCGKPFSFYGYLLNSADADCPFLVTDETFMDDGFLEPPAEDRANVPAYLYEHVKQTFEYAVGFGEDFFLFISADCRCELTKAPEGGHLAIRLRYANNGRVDEFTIHNLLAGHKEIVEAGETWLGRIALLSREVGRS
ncbi:MAG: hypothetical protein V4550_18335 [Gemmatimonadota bacterium]